jgi:AAA domain
MKAVIQNFRGIAEAHIDISPIALITGHNYAGKTSIARAIAAAATGKPIPYDKVTKKDCGVILRHGTKSGTVILSTEEGNTSVAWPKADVSSEGRPPASSAIAAGLTDLLSMPHKEALGYVISLLKADVTEKELIDSLVNAGVEEKTAKTVWLTIDAQGWDAALSRAKDTGSKLKGSWETHTREKFGSKKAAEWFPQAWDDSLQNATPDGLAEDVKVARKNLEVAIAKNAVNAAEIGNLKALAASIPTLEQQKKDAEEVVGNIQKELSDIDEKLGNAPNPDAKHSYTCPHCEGKVNVTAVSGSKYTLTKAVVVPESQLKEARLAQAALSGEQQNASQRLADARARASGIVADINAAKRAQDKMAKLGDVALDPAAEDTTAADREALAKAEMRAEALRIFMEVRKVSKQITDNQIIIDMLDETGLRRTMLDQRITAFQNHYLDPLCQTFGMSEMNINADLEVSFGSTPFSMFSGSEKFRAKTVIQLAIAQLEKASLVIIDDADILDQAGRGKLLKTVLQAGIPAVICMTLAKPDMAPNLAQAGVGATYWVEGNTCKPVQILKPVAPGTVTVIAPAPETELPPVPSSGFMQKVREARDGAVA